MLAKPLAHDIDYDFPDGRVRIPCGWHLGVKQDEGIRAFTCTYLGRVVWTEQSLAFPALKMYHSRHNQSQ